MPSPRSASRGKGVSFLTPASLRRSSGPESPQILKDAASAKRSSGIAEASRSSSPETCHAYLDEALQILEKRITIRYADLQSTVTCSFQEIVLICSQLHQHREAMSQQMTEIQTLVRKALTQQHDVLAIQHDMLAIQIKDMASSMPPVFPETRSTGSMAPDAYDEIEDTTQNMSGSEVFNPCLDRDGLVTGGRSLAEPMDLSAHQVSSKCSLEEFEEVIAKARVQEDALRRNMDDINRSLRTESAEFVEKATAHGGSDSAKALPKPHVKESFAQTEAVGIGREGYSIASLMDVRDANECIPNQAMVMEKPSMREKRSIERTSCTTKKTVFMRSSTQSAESMLSSSKTDFKNTRDGSKVSLFSRPTFPLLTRKTRKKNARKLPSLFGTPARSLDSGTGSAAQCMFRDDLDEGILVETPLVLSADGRDRSLYKEDHWATRILFNEKFTQLNLFVICLNAMYVGMEAHFNAIGESLYASHVSFMVASNLFCMFFVLDWCFQVAAYADRKVMITRLRPCVETVLVLLTVLDTWCIEPLLYMYDVSLDISPLKVLGILSFARVTRFVGAIPELLTLMRGIVMATRAVFWSLAMVAVFTYTFAVILVTLLQSDDALNDQMGRRNFQNLRNACWVLIFDAGLLEEFGTKMAILGAESTFRTVLASSTMFIYMFIINLTILNLLAGAMLEVVKSLTSESQTEFAVALMKQTILKQLYRFVDADGLVSRDDLQRVLDDEEADLVLRSLNVNRIFLLEMQDLLFPNEQSQVSVPAFIEVLLLCRGDNAVTVQTLANSLLYIASLIYKMETQLMESRSCEQLPLSIGTRSCPEDAMPAMLVTTTEMTVQGADDVVV